MNRNYHFLLIKKLIILIALCFLSACASYNSIVYVPCPDSRQAIEDGENVDNQCKERAIAYHDAVSAAGVESCVACGVLSQYSQPLFHCWNEVKCPEDGKWKLIDVSRSMLEFQDGWDVEQSPEYMPYVRFNGKVTIGDIKWERNYSWKSDKPLDSIAQQSELSWLPIISEWAYIF